MGMCAYIIASQNGRPELPATAKVTCVALQFDSDLQLVFGVENFIVPAMTLTFCLKKMCVFRHLQLVPFQSWSLSWKFKLKTWGSDAV